MWVFTRETDSTLSFQWLGPFIGQFPCDMLFHSGLSCTANVIPRKTLNWPILMIILANSLACDAADKQLIYRGPGWMIYQENILLKLLLSLYCIGKWPCDAFQCRTVMNTKTKKWRFVLPGPLVFLLRLGGIAWQHVFPWVQLRLRDGGSRWQEPHGSVEIRLHVS